MTTDFLILFSSGLQLDQAQSSVSGRSLRRGTGREPIAALRQSIALQMYPKPVKRTIAKGFPYIISDRRKQAGRETRPLQDE
jgi:hypothetical protein